MARKPLFATIRTEGGLLPSDLLARVASDDRDLPGLGPEDYHLAKGERIGEAITRSWNRLIGAWASLRTHLGETKSDDAATGLTRDRFLLPLFAELGFGRLAPSKGIAVGDASFPVSHAWGAVPIHLVGARVDLDRRTAGVAGAARSSPHSLVQDLLNRSDEYLWGIVANGERLRLLRDNSSMTRQAFVEFDLVAMFEGEVYADFVVLWLTCHQSRFEAERPEACLLERWTQAAVEQGTRALEQLRDGVERAIQDLGQGLLSNASNGALRDRLRSGELSTQDYYRQLLRVVYRLLFLFAAEDRNLLLTREHDADASRERYVRYYSTTRLRSLARTRRGSTHPDLWRALRVVMDALGSEGRPELGLPVLGSFLWSKEAVGALEGCEIANKDLLAAVAALAFTKDRHEKVARDVDYRNLGAEELGSVYESLLELHPEINLEAATFTLSSAAGHERKVTGSYYTPTSLITVLLDSSLDPLLDEAVKADDPERALLALKVCDPACGSGHFLIAAAHRIARQLAMVRTADPEPAPDSMRTALRDVIGQCIYGIDVNPMAVELCKVSMWLETLEPGKPLSFLDHRIVCGNSLLGATPKLLEAGIPDDAFKALTGDDKVVVTALKKRNRAERKEHRGQGVLELTSPRDLVAPLASEVEAIDALDDSSIEGVREKEERWRKLTDSPDAAHAAFVADAWCAAFVIPKRRGVQALTEGVFRRLRDEPEKIDADLADEIERLKREHRFLHWHLAFPDVFHFIGDGAPNERTGWHGGFDVISGNPPWEQLQYDPREVFASSHPEIAQAPTMAKRNRLLAALEQEDQPAFGQHLENLRRMEGDQHFVHASGRFPLTSFGRLNTAPLFVELMRDAISPVGRVGVVVPTGIATDSFNQYFFQDIVERKALASLYDFENKVLFPEVHKSYKFCLLTLTGTKRPVKEATFVFFAHETPDLADPERRFTLTASDFELLNPNTRTCPVFRTRRDAEITKKIYRNVPVLVKEGPPEENPWGIKFLLMFMMNTDSHLFRTRDELEADGWVLNGNVFERPADSGRGGGGG
ncbi:MAG: N-6 DNA methylase, partial [Actinomycetota bacterium]